MFVMSDENEWGNNEFEPQYEDPEWSDYRTLDQDPKPEVSLELKDYVALFIASLQTIFLPLIILIIVMVAISFIFTFWL